MGRLATAEEIAAMVVYLSSEEVREIEEFKKIILKSFLYRSLLLLLALNSKLTVAGASKTDVIFANVH